MQQSETSVLIVGAGPVGMMAALLLRQQGIDARLFDRRDGPNGAPAAHVVNARTFEICRSVGVDMDVLLALAGDPADYGYTRWMTRLAGEEIASLPFERQEGIGRATSPTPLRNLSQHRFERVLRDTIAAKGAAAIEYGQQWEGAEQDAEGVVSRVRDLATDTVREVRSRFVIAADGAGSRVRKWLGIEMVGPPRIESFVMAHVRANLRELVKDRPGVLYWICDPEAGGVLVAHDIDREWVYMIPFDPDVEAPESYTAERCRERVLNAIGSSSPPDVEIASISTWTMSAQVAESFRSGHVFLAGDAAHRFPPTGGLGLNSGVQDVHGLVWRLAAVLREQAPARLLDSYEVERRAVARYNADQSLRNATKLIQVPAALGVLEHPTTDAMRAALDDPATRRRVEDAIANQAEHFDMLGLQLGFVYEHGAVAPDGTPPPDRIDPVREYVPTTRPGARLPHAWLERDGERVSTLDLTRPGAFTLFASIPCDAWEHAAREIEGIPIEVVAIGRDVHDPDAEWVKHCEIARDGALLVRPDQHVGWRSAALPEDPTRALARAVAQIVSGQDASSGEC